MQNFPATPYEMAASFWRNRSLIFQLIQREVIGRYKGSMIGLAWSFFNPLLMLLIFTFVFGVVFKSKWGIDPSSKASFAIILFVGMIVNTLFSECFNRAPTLILSNVNYVKKIVFPLEIWPFVSVGSALVHGFISLVVLILVQYVINQNLPWTAIFFPILLIPLIGIILGLSWFLASLGVYFRDISQMTPMVSTALMFFAPVFYPLSALPEQYHDLVKLNPLTLPIMEGRNVLIYGISPNIQDWFISLVAGLLVAYLGFWWFQKSRKGFADVL
jgi:lipopolysaccharide transport system permease protein